MRDHYDLIVVGTGFASTFFLKKYLEKTGSSTKVLVLERGFLYPHGERLKDLRGENTSFAKLNPDHASTFINRNPDKHWPFTVGFGGSSNCWYGCTPRFMPSDFKMKSLYGVARDWPITYEELDPYYTEVENLMGISGPEETPFPKTTSYPLPPHAFSTVDKVMHKEYGNLYISQPTARASRPVNGRNACCVSAMCSVCPVNAKFTIENSRLGVYEDERIELVFGAQVSSLDLQQGIAKKVNFIKDGRDHQVGGDVIALGANAIFNAAILLNSGDSNPLTGKYLGEQLGLDAVVYLKDLANVGGSTWVSANGYMLYDGEHRKERAACLMEANNALYLRLESGKWRNLVTFRMIFEDLPQQENYVAMGKEPLKPEVHFKKASDYTMKAVAYMKEKLPEVLACLPVENIKYLEPYKTEAHILGTTSMSHDAATGVIDKHLIHHNYRNLFVLGSGSFTTFSPNNPTLTLSALSLHAADRSF
ncbi:GMC family oxidoreductase [Fulvivirgaceae bacterium PWU4]|uniref:GMC family oxidoreductase n=1 Tax=Chryseosolibacter histidini TaxID=2782349 RepID=A0AAP2DHJ2_9BACT|nr:GMC family oxidoreductase [Chryseosolibacter histidini]MBT1695719.1 GMC family oxidoreductase [Chryseosolibacter histidini]